jgi:hypothetical protein
MKNTFFGLLTCLCFVGNTNAQINEGFTSPFVFSPSGNGWLRVNNSLPAGTLSWFSGNGATTFPAYNGGPNDYVACNFNSQGSAAGGISNFLITPTVTIANGGVFQFATRTTTSATWADRLQVRFSFGVGGTIPSGTTSVGTYTNLLLDINPNLSTANASVVSNGTVAGYPQDWVVYTFTLSGIAAPGAGRFAFRYFVNDGGPVGANSDYIGLDEVKYTLPCSVSLTNFTVCSGSSTTLNAIGGTPPITYTWSPGGSPASSIVVTPVATSVYTLAYNEGSVVCPPVTATVTIGNQLNTLISSSSPTVCSGGTVALSAFASATGYTWSNGANTSTTTVTPSSPSTTYTVAVSNGACFGANTISIGVPPNPSLSITFSPSIICCNATVDVIFTGANTYTSYLNTFPPLVGNPIFLYTDNTDSNTNFTLVVQGSDANGCVGSATVIQYVQPLPTITIASPTVVCAGSAFTLSASGAATYTWGGPGTISGSANPATFVAPSSAGMMNLTANGTTTLGCQGTGAVAISVSDCVGIKAQSTGDLDLAVYPNPFQDVLKISGFKGGLKIYNALGQLVFSQEIQYDETINTSSFTKGAYSIQLKSRSGEASKTIKLMKN